MVGREPQVPIFDAHAVRPLYISTPNEGRYFDVRGGNDAFICGVRAGCVETVQHCRIRQRGYRGVEIGDGILLCSAHVDAALVIGSEALEIAAYLANGLHCIEDLGVC